MGSSLHLVSADLQLVQNYPNPFSYLGWDRDTHPQKGEGRVKATSKETFV